MMEDIKKNSSAAEPDSAGHSSERESPPRLKWYFRTMTLVIGFLSVGPLMLPLLWFHPRYKLITKIMLTLILLFLSYLFVVATTKLLASLRSQYEELFKLLNL